MGPGKKGRGRGDSQQSPCLKKEKLNGEDVGGWLFFWCTLPLLICKTRMTKWSAVLGVVHQ